MNARDRPSELVYHDNQKRGHAIIFWRDSRTLFVEIRCGQMHRTVRGGTNKQQFIYLGRC